MEVADFVVEIYHGSWTFVVSFFHNFFKINTAKLVHKLTFKYHTNLNLNNRYHKNHMRVHQIMNEAKIKELGD